MGKKYIQGKDGKFKGSVSDGKSTPQAGPSLPTRIAKPADEQLSLQDEFRRLTERFTAKKAHQEAQSFPLVDDIMVDPHNPHETHYASSASEEIEGVVENDGSAYIAHIASSFDAGYEILEEKFFTSRSEADTWVKKELSQRLELKQDFQWNWENNRMQFIHDLENHRCQEDMDEEVSIHFGHPRADLQTVMNWAYVRYHDEGQYSVRIDHFPDPYEDGEEYVVYSAKTFEEGLNLARHFLLNNL